MVHYIVIRESTLQDTQQINDVIRNAYLSNTLTSWFNALMKEVSSNSGIFMKNLPKKRFYTPA